MPGQTYLQVSESLLGWLWLTVETRTLAELSEYLLLWTLLETHFDTKTWPYPKACRCQCWNTSCKTINRAGTQPHTSTERQPKVFLNPQPHKAHRLTQLLPSKGREKLHTPKDRQKSLLPGNLLKPVDQLYPTGADTSSKRNDDPVASRIETTHTESF